MFKFDEMNKKKEHIPLRGVGPIYVNLIILMTIIGITLSARDVVHIGTIGWLRLPFMVVGIGLIIIGAVLWSCAVFHSKIDSGILNNRLVTTGVYAYVRNPIYSAFIMFCTGLILIANDLWLCILPFVYWLFLTILMKNTEEKWLRKLYGEEYEIYCKKVNRCIPWFKKR